MRLKPGFPAYWPFLNWTGYLFFVRGALLVVRAHIAHPLILVPVFHIVVIVHTVVVLGSCSVLIGEFVIFVLSTLGRSIAYPLQGLLRVSVGKTLDIEVVVVPFLVVLFLGVRLRIRIGFSAVLDPDLLLGFLLCLFPGNIGGLFGATSITDLSTFFVLLLLLGRLSLGLPD